MECQNLYANSTTPSMAQLLSSIKVSLVRRGGGGLDLTLDEPISLCFICYADNLRPDIYNTGILISFGVWIDLM